MEGRILVLAGWTGRRRASDPPYEQDRTDYLKLQAKALRAHRHRLDLVVVMLPANPEEGNDVRWFLHTLETEGVGCPVVVKRRKNLGMSYGSWSDAYGLFRGPKYSWWFLFEDDQIPCRDDWDEEMIGELRAHPEACYLGSTVRTTPKLHIGIGWGVGPASTLENTWDRYGCLPHSKGVGRTLGHSYRRAELEGNVGMYAGMHEATGKGFVDFRHKYRTGYIWPDGSLIWEFGEHKESIVLPAQVYRDPAAEARILRTDFSEAAIKRVRDMEHLK